MREFSNVKVMMGEKKEILALYNLLKADGIMVDIYCFDQVAELRVLPQDYVKALEMGTRRAFQNRFKAVAWVAPDGEIRYRFADTVVKTYNIQKQGLMPAFSGSSAIEAGRVATYIQSAGIDVVKSVSSVGTYQVEVKPEDYMKAVNLGAIYANGHHLTSVFWNDPTGAPEFNMATVAQIASNEVVEVQEA